MINNVYRFGTGIALLFIVRTWHRSAEQSGGRPAVIQTLQIRGAARRDSSEGSIQEASDWPCKGLRAIFRGGEMARWLSGESFG